MKNDAELNQHTLAVKALGNKLDLLMRDGKEIRPDGSVLTLYHALDLIEDEARKAKWRWNDLRFAKE